MKFSVVIPVKDEYQLVPTTLPTYYQLAPEEVLLCMDNPPHRETLRTIKQVAQGYSIKTRIIKVERNSDYEFHQAWVRRKGFQEAEHDRILTGDIDLIVNSKALKTLEYVGKNDVGLCSTYKLYLPRDFTGFLRGAMRAFMSQIVHPIWKKQQSTGLKRGNFTGCYALWRPYWLDSENEGIKKLHNPKQEIRVELESYSSSKVGMGEDTYLRDCMEQKHRVMYLPDVGCISVGKQVQYHPNVQFETGRYYYHRGRSPLGALLKSIMYLQPHHLRGYLYEMILRILA